MILKCEMICLFRENGQCNRIQTTFGVLKGSGIIGCKHFVPLTCMYCVLYSNKECEGESMPCDKFIMSTGNDWIGFEDENNTDAEGTTDVSS